MAVGLESGTFRTLGYDLNIENSLNSIPTIGANHKMPVSVGVLV
jgi:hypothetical protein